MFCTSTTGYARLGLIVFLAAQLAACGVPKGYLGELDTSPPDTTYGKFLARANAGDAESQNAVGYMLFYGEGVRMDRSRARLWFQRGAAQGNANAQRNLAILSAANAPESTLAPARIPPRTPNQTPQAGQVLYEKYCAGCHGFNGISAYVHSPSFALGERLDKPDGELMRTLLLGKGEMPNWDDKFSRDQLQDVLRFVRTLQAQYALGIGQTLSSAPPVFYIFGPMNPDHSNYRGVPGDYGLDPPPANR
jgi:mono/diheme cytochrome c family protein